MFGRTGCCYRRIPAQPRLLNLVAGVDQGSLGDSTVSEVLTSHLFRSLCPGDGAARLGISLDWLHWKSHRS